jgi:sugar lactone lactonase YvrE
MVRELQDLITGLNYGECPRWHDGRLWLVDFYSHHVLSFAEDGSDRRVEADIPQQPSGIGWLPDGRLLVVSSTSLSLLC